jgi:hypothetical protein
MKVVLVEWAGYPLKRDKVIGTRIVKCGLGRILTAIKRYDAGLPIQILIVINCLQPSDDCIDTDMRLYHQLTKRYPFVESLYFRNNKGLDIGAYDFAYNILLRDGYEGEILFMNSSVSGPIKNNWLLKYIHQFQTHDGLGLCGITLNSHNTSRSPSCFAPHVQSFFILSRMGILKHALGSTLMPNQNTMDKREVIEHGEIAISTSVLNSGYAINALMFPNFAYRRGDLWQLPLGDIRSSCHCSRPNLII